MRLAAEEARWLLGSARVAYLATVTERNRPHLVPVTFDLHQEVIVIAVDQKPKSTTDLRRLRNIAGNDRVAVLAEHYDDADWSRLWWVRADGSARVLVEEPDRAEPLRRLRAKYPQYRADPPTGPVIRIEVDRWAGWRHAGRHVDG
jgi:PPOX class probable F420-dependent enzyme